MSEKLPIPSGVAARPSSQIVPIEGPDDEEHSDLHSLRAKLNRLGEEATARHLRAEEWRTKMTETVGRLADGRSEDREMVRALAIKTDKMADGFYALRRDYEQGRVEDRATLEGIKMMFSRHGESLVDAEEVTQKHGVVLEDHTKTIEDHKKRFTPRQLLLASAAAFGSGAAYSIWQLLKELLK